MFNPEKKWWNFGVGRNWRIVKLQLETQWLCSNHQKKLTMYSRYIQNPKIFCGSPQKKWSLPIIHRASSGQPPTPSTVNRWFSWGWRFHPMVQWNMGPSIYYFPLTYKVIFHLHDYEKKRSLLSPNIVSLQCFCKKNNLQFPLVPNKKQFLKEKIRSWSCTRWIPNLSSGTRWSGRFAGLFLLRVREAAWKDWFYSINHMSLEKRPVQYEVTSSDHHFWGTCCRFRVPKGA